MVRIEEKFKLKTEAYINMLADFDRYVNVVGYKAKSKRYQKFAQEFLFKMEEWERFDIKQIRTVDLANYHMYLSTREYLNKPKLLSRSFVANHMQVINLFFDYLLQNRNINGTLILPSRPIGIERNPLVISQEEITLIYKSLKNKRDKAFFSVAYGCGLRRSELESLNVSDILLKKKILIVRSGKNAKRREIPLSNHILEDLEKYLYYSRDKYLLPNTLNTAFFISNNGNRMKGGQFYIRLKTIIKKTKNETLINKNVTLHSLRHSISSHLIDNGARIEDVKRFLGHDDIDTSHIYVKRRKMKNLIIKNVN